MGFPRMRTMNGRWRWRRLVLLGLFIVFLGWPLSLLMVFRLAPVPATPLMVLRLFEGEGLAKDWVPLEAIAPALRRAVIASEDGRFCQHGGFDTKELEKAWSDYQRGDRLRGASTLSMQTAKNLMLWDGRNWLRKGLEAYDTVLLEALWPKRRILEVYLNIVEWGPGIYGAEAAARHHFGVSAAALSSRQAALLAVVLPNPREWSAGRPGAYVSRRAATIQARMNAVDLGKDGACG
ncbi:monofunctional biosynthetic peptidoglycan transglycosylase [Rhodospirillum rubrum]|uniref:monofunctional biosynthetic peptidoglycan transglycosylase n=1 Tax=Rhodospirillum rubrum TaxID=1085 RepID=UPI001906F96D|nr:monofunctional biosynthetic peptidoglycan transglycosylase [Rhodospirillum rubrum]MBK1665001.1 monofunctional biosynthetic peptidoglycan transglycosylase [Rhodospirillum rubrum]MBK1677206.1 monofunctional biosynthetic peptidoglycan transglycosylase [Rhodospirillum rubrum]